MLRPLIPPDGVVLDVGAHAGQYAKLFARLVPRGLVLACEPGTYARTILRAAIRLNGLRQVAILPFGLGDRAGVNRLSIPVKRSGSYGFGLSYMGRDDGKWPVEIEAVPVVTLDGLAETLELRRLDFIKADIEGFERRFLEGARQTLARFRPALLLELNDAYLSRAGDTLEETWQMLAGLGYRAFEPGAERKPVPAPRNGDVLWLPGPVT
jgi:FkbM family methyltransferase